MASSSKRKTTHDVEVDADKRLKIVAKLATIRGVSKTGLSRILHSLNQQGLLHNALVNTPDASLKTYQRCVQTAFEKDALWKMTPYGQILREMPLPIVGKLAQNKHRPSMWYLHPFALLYTLCSINASLLALIKNETGTLGTKKLRIVLYFDGVNPGNPLHPDPQQLLQAVYWTFLDLPSWFLRRKDSWFVFSLARELWAKALAGEMSEFCKLVLRCFFFGYAS